MFQIAEFTKFIPIKVAHFTKQTKLLLKLCDLFFRIDHKKLCVLNKYNIIINQKRKAERLLFCFYYNMIRYYRGTSLYKYMKGMPEKGFFMDIGANFGIYCNLAKQLGFTSFAFEADPDYIAFLQRNSTQYDRLFPVALSNVDGESLFYKAGDINPGAGSLILGSNGWAGGLYNEAIRVPTHRFDSIITDQEVFRKIRLVKIDVEGAEYEVVCGMERVWELGYRIDIYCEVRGYQTNRSPGSYERVIQYLEKYDYMPYVEVSGQLIPFTKKYERNVFDLFFLKNILPIT